MSSDPNRRPGCAGEGGFPAEDPVELRRVPHGFVDLESHLLAAENEVRRIERWALVGREEGASLLGDSGGVPRQVQLADELPATRPVLAAHPREASSLGLALSDGRRLDQGARLDDVLVDRRALG